MNRLKTFFYSKYKYSRFRCFFIKNFEEYERVLRRIYIPDFWIVVFKKKIFKIRNFFIENLINIRELYCYRNKLRSIEVIENLINLDELCCYDNQLTDLNGIENLINITYL